jgi:hypothetical protein
MSSAVYLVVFAFLAIVYLDPFAGRRVVLVSCPLASDDGAEGLPSLLYTVPTKVLDDEFEALGLDGISYGTLLHTLQQSRDWQEVRERWTALLSRTGSGHKVDAVMGLATRLSNMCVRGRHDDIITHICRCSFSLGVPPPAPPPPAARTETRAPLPVRR